MPFSADQVQFETIYGKNMTRLVRYAAKRVNNLYDAEELAGEALLILWQKQREQEIAERLGLPEGSCRARFCRAKARLRNLLTRP